mmetsp:Transcript_15275/g.29607  ORF Transcript_15275/g.29607 Transcript_15275/m.29607 type:complete len:442 (+) Transcript_15275:675-2000(+)|eukprot:CAMPEP_0171566028 /NCGR_PEP_ID=MMETSP0961-20121227/319_1 /TAXON_ID=87120 /ORGANISM="Aurantiochytrium limacinum, Strain ATCCMYA-1381" /LENGTH=441 /DNA_ID=CAMNT_0012119677 /DNA_START=652 /DNA_END=1977 /DNA_ORIENTATION=-
MDADEDDAVQKKRQRTAEQSRASRLKRKYELEQLRQTNQQLKDERESFRAKIKQLEMQVQNNISSETVDIIRENSALRLQLQMHQKFMQAFMKLASGPSTLAGQRVLCREGADAAQSYVHALVAESLKSWKPLKLPAPYVFPLDDFQLHHCVTENFFGSRGQGMDDVKRLNLRLDMSFPGVKADEVADYYWKAYQSAEEMDRLLSFKALELETVDVPDDDTVVMYNRKTWNTPHHKPTDVSFKANDEDVVFIIKRKDELMPRSTLRPPECTGSSVASTASVGTPSETPATSSTTTSSSTMQTGLPGQNPPSDPFVGKAKATVVAMTSTRSTHEAMRSYQNASAPRSEDGTATSKVQHITSVIAQGAVAWYDDRAQRSRLIVVLSYPQNFRWLNITFSDVVKDGSVTGEGFAQLLLHIGSRLQTVFQSQMSDWTLNPASPVS